MSLILEGLGILIGFVLLAILWFAMSFSPIAFALWNDIRRNKKPRE